VFNKGIAEEKEAKCIVQGVLGSAIHVTVMRPRTRAQEKFSKGVNRWKAKKSDVTRRGVRKKKKGENDRHSLGARESPNQTGRGGRIKN